MPVGTLVANDAKAFVTQLKKNPMLAKVPPALAAALEWTPPLVDGIGGWGKSARDVLGT